MPPNECSESACKRHSNLRPFDKWRHSRGVQSWWPLLCAGLVCCGGSAQPIAAPIAKPKPIAAIPPPAPRPNNTLYRDEVEAARRAGLGHLFELVELEPKGDVDSQGRMTSFNGFQIVTLRPASKWLSFDFAPGDVLTHINGVSVEHYSTWLEQFEAAAKADQIRVDLIRDGQRKTVIVRIADRNRAPAANPKQVSSTPQGSRL